MTQLTLLRVSAQPSGWSACPARGRRRPVYAWGIFAEDGGHSTAVGLVARGQTLVRADRLQGFEGYAPGPGCEPQLDPLALPPADLNAAMFAALEPITDDWTVFESRIRENLAAAADAEWATLAIAGFNRGPGFWFRAWLRARREHEATERDLMLRLRALSLVAPGRSFEEALDVTGITLGGLIAAPPPPSSWHSHSRHKLGQGGSS